jgi:2,5-dioxopentanoate dehydrogenase
LGAEVFGPLGLIVRVHDVYQMHAIAQSLTEQLTCKHLDAADIDLARALMPVE